MPESASVPVPTLVSLPVLEITPAKAVLVLSPPTVSSALPRFTLPPAAPPPARDPMRVAKLLRLSVAPLTLPMVTAELLPNAPLTPATEATPAVSVPALTVVAPV